MFLECIVVEKFKKKTFKWLDYILFHKQEMISVENINFMFNNCSGQHAEFLNVCISIMKPYIYAKKCLRQQLSTIEFVTNLHNVYVDEKFLAFNNNRVFKFCKRWSIYHDYCAN